MVDSPQVVALRKLAQGDALTVEEQALLTASGRKPAGSGVPHAQVLDELAERQRHRHRGA